MKKVFMYLLTNHGFDILSVVLKPLDDTSISIGGNVIVSQSLMNQTGYILADTLESAEKECERIVQTWRQAMYN